MKKLNLGSGKNPVKGYINIDIRPEAKDVDMILNCEKLPFAEKSIDEVFAKDLLEHFGWRKWKKVLREWVRVLKDGGVIKLRFPDLSRIIDEFKDNRMSFERMVQLIFGDQDYLQNFHKTGLTLELVATELEQLNCTILQAWYDGGRDARITAVKGNKKPLVDLKHPL